MQRREMAHLMLTTASHDCILEARLEDASCASYACNFSCFYQSV